jgi:putative hydrolase of the HAD superfamily
MAAQPNPTSGAVLLDALGTLLRLEPPAPLLRAELARRTGHDPGEPAAVAAIRAEIAYYRAHIDEGRDAASLAELRGRCAEAMRPALAPPLRELPGEVLTAALLGALRFSAYPDAAPALRRLRAAGWPLVVVSNWDASLEERLAETGLAGLVDGAVASAVAGAAKPDPVIYTRALALVDARPDASLHVGDTVEADVAGALAAGIAPVLLDRHDAADAPEGVPVIRSLAELPALAQYPPSARR